MNQPTSLLELMREHSFNDSVNLTTQQVHSMEELVEEHLANNYDPMDRAKLGSLLRGFNQQKSKNSCTALGFCLVFIAWDKVCNDPGTAPARLLLTHEEFKNNYLTVPEIQQNDHEVMYNKCNCMRTALYLLEGNNNKGMLMEIVAKVFDGPSGLHQTGGGKIAGQKRKIPVEIFFEQESGIFPQPSRKPPKIPRLDSSDSVGSATVSEGGIPTLPETALPSSDQALVKTEAATDATTAVSVKSEVEVEAKIETQVEPAASVKTVLLDTMSLPAHSGIPIVTNLVTFETPINL